MRLLLIAAYLAVSLLGLSAIGLFMSTLTDVPVGAMAATVVLSVVSQVLDALPQLEWLHPWLFSHYWLDFGGSAPPAGFLGLLRRRMRCCRAATSPCSARWPTAGSSPRTCSPRTGRRPGARQQASRKASVPGRVGVELHPGHGGKVGHGDAGVRVQRLDHAAAAKVDGHVVEAGCRTPDQQIARAGLGERNVDGRLGKLLGGRARQVLAGRGKRVLDQA